MPALQAGIRVELTECNSPQELGSLAEVDSLTTDGLVISMKERRQRRKKGRSLDILSVRYRTGPVSDADVSYLAEGDKIASGRTFSRRDRRSADHRQSHQRRVRVCTLLPIHNLLDGSQYYCVYIATGWVYVNCTQKRLAKFTKPYRLTTV